MYKSVCPLLFLILLITSCSNSAVTDKLYHSDNLKNQVEKKRENIQWTMELEKSRLTEKISSIEYISSTNRLTPQTMMAFEAGNERNAIYPELDGFASLDLLDTDANAVNVINNFCAAISHEKECGNYFDENSLFSLVLFVNDMNDFNFKNCWWYIGSGFVGEYALEIPVRLVNNSMIVDTKVYLREIQAGQNTQNNPQKQNGASSYKIVDIEIEGIKNRF